MDAAELEQELRGHVLRGEFEVVDTPAEASPFLKPPARKLKAAAGSSEAFTNHRSLANVAELARGVPIIFVQASGVLNVDLTRGMADVPDGRCGWLPDGRRVTVRHGRCETTELPDPDAPPAVDQ